MKPEDVSIAVLLPLAREVAGAMLMFADDLDDGDASLGFYLCSIPSHTVGAPPVAVVLAQPSQIGNVHAAMTVVRLREKYPNLRAVIVCGIAGGAPKPSDNERDVYLGDIVVLGPGGVLHYDHGHDKRRPPLPGTPPAPPRRDGYFLDPRDPPIKPDESFLKISNSLSVREDKGDDQPWLLRLENRMPFLVQRNGKFRRPDEAEGCGYESVNGDTVELVIRKSGRTSPRVFIGAMGSGNCVLKNPYRRDELRDGKPPILAIEMEAAGAAAACASLGLMFTSVRGICDYCDENKNNNWQFYAAATAAAYTYCLIQRIPADAILVRGRGAGVVPETLELERAASSAGAPGSPSASSAVGGLMPQAFSSESQAQARRAPTPEVIAAETQLRNFLDDVVRADARHDTAILISRALQIEAELPAIERLVDPNLLADVLQQMARAYLQHARETSVAAEKNERLTKARALVARAREMAR